MQDSRPAFRPWPHLAVWAVAVWVLTGALFKLLAASPKDLPEVVRTASPFALALTYKLVIAVELAGVALAFLRPRLAWPFLAALLLVFLGVLVTQIAAGDESCGCFGTKVTMSPWVMLGIDSTLLALLVASRPWRGLARVAPVPAAAVVALLVAAAPWAYDRQVSVPVVRRTPAETPAPSGAEAPATEPAGAPDPAAAEPEEEEGGTRPTWAILSPEEWVGQNVFDIDLTRNFLGEDAVSTFPPDATWIFYRQGCSHCAEHLEELALSDDGLTYYVLLQVPDDLDQPREVHIVPAGAHVIEAPLPEGIDYVMTTPADMTVVGYEVVAAREEIEHGD